VKGFKGKVEVKHMVVEQKQEPARRGGVLGKRRDRDIGEIYASREENKHVAMAKFDTLMQLQLQQEVDNDMNGSSNN
jgi:hypothetical protein